MSWGNTMYATLVVCCQIWSVVRYIIPVFALQPLTCTLLYVSESHPKTTFKLYLPRFGWDNSPGGRAIKPFSFSCASPTCRDSIAPSVDSLNSGAWRSQKLDGGGVMSLSGGKQTWCVIREKSHWMWQWDFEVLGIFQVFWHWPQNCHEFTIPGHVFIFSARLYNKHLICCIRVTRVVACKEQHDPCPD